MRRGLIAAMLLALLVVALGFKSSLVTAPPLRETPASGSFDTARAMTRLTRILGDQRPHPVDSAANDAVRDRLLAELRGIGLTPTVTDAFACAGAGSLRFAGCARVRNVRATIGPAAGPHLLVVSHYDSTPAGPGAGDDGIGMAVMLETASLLKGRHLARPVTFLFTDGEEAGLLGARAFLDRDPLAARVDSAINFEARGVTGPAIMFETSRPNGAAIEIFSRTSRRPVASSMTADAYALIPNATDVTFFAERPWTMLNFAIIGNESRYHSPDDSIANLDRRSVQHMGDQGLAAVSALAERTTSPSRRTVVYSDVLGRGLVEVPLWAGLAGLAILIAGFVLLAWRGRQGLGRPLAAVVLALVASTAAVFVGQTLLGLIKGGLFWRAHPELISLAVDLSALAATVAVLLWLKPPGRRTLRLAFWLVFVLLGGLIAIFAPGASILFLAPGLVAILGILAQRRVRRAEQVGSLTAWLLLFLSWAPVLHLAETLLDFQLAPIFAPVAALLVLPVVIEFEPWLRSARRAPPLLLAAGAFAAGWAAVAIAPAYDPVRKQNFRVDYAWDAAARSGAWGVAHDGGPLPAAFAAFRVGMVPWSLSKKLTTPAPAIPVPAPTLQRIGERAMAGGRLVRLRLATGGSETVLLRAEGNAGLREVRAAGARARFGDGHSDSEPYLLRCQGRSCDGLTFDLLLGAAEAATITVIGIHPGLPAAAAPLLRARPSNASPQYAPDSRYAWTKIEI